MRRAGIPKETTIIMTTSVDILSVGALPNPSTAVLWKITRKKKYKEGGNEERRNAGSVERKVYTVFCEICGHSK